ncbi:carbohydrate ABC transporter permease [Streptomyces chiangmaiensis]|uniref:Carbohydrate ABC transporter permease n=1 Tax=Streptomyces chiangmaiensis TaxID=766497 RepID=A0ABU7FT32_9ACTN|nr:carbohydrate ABC transporter permease [Streptomyces chiangmaiensis]MED7827134.1 carbohydrate ABC transporter permease [Streptomyces chiangmaiensis]
MPDPQRFRHRLRATLPLVVLVPGAAVMIFPFVWMLLSSLKSGAEVSHLPPTLWPHKFQFSNYATTWRTPPQTFGRYYLNSFILAAGGTLLKAVIATLAAYAFAHMRFPGRRLLFAAFLATMMIPGEVTLIPNFVTIRHLPFIGGNDGSGYGGHGLYDTYLGMILPSAADAFSIFLLRQAFLSIPADYWEAARLDGCGRLRYLWSVALPMVRPALAVVVVLSTFEYWNSLLWPLVVTNSEAIRPVQVGILYLQGEFNSQPNLIMAAAALSILPMLALYLLAQRQFRESVAYSGLRG